MEKCPVINFKFEDFLNCIDLIFPSKPVFPGKSLSITVKLENLLIGNFCYDELHVIFSESESETTLSFSAFNVKVENANEVFSVELVSNGNIKEGKYYASQLYVRCGNGNARSNSSSYIGNLCLDIESQKSCVALDCFPRVDDSNLITDYLLPLNVCIDSKNDEIEDGTLKIYSVDGLQIPSQKIRLGEDLAVLADNLDRSISSNVLLIPQMSSHSKFQFSFCFFLDGGLFEDGKQYTVIFELYYASKGLSLQFKRSFEFQFKRPLSFEYQLCKLPAKKCTALRIKLINCSSSTIEISKSSVSIPDNILGVVDLNSDSVGKEIFYSKSYLQCYLLEVDESRNVFEKILEEFLGSYSIIYSFNDFKQHLKEYDIEMNSNAEVESRWSITIRKKDLLLNEPQDSSIGNIQITFISDSLNFQVGSIVHAKFIVGLNADHPPKLIYKVDSNETSWAFSGILKSLVDFKRGEMMRPSLSSFQDCKYIGLISVDLIPVASGYIKIPKVKLKQELSDGSLRKIDYSDYVLTGYSPLINVLPRGHAVIYPSQSLA
jgi:hypothetical protein